MKLEDGRIAFLVNQDYTEIELQDAKANTTFAVIRLTPVQLSQMLSRMGGTRCDIQVFGLDRIGKKHENQTFEFEVPEHLAHSSNADLLALAANELLKDGWEADAYFSSQGSFFKKDGKQYARCTIRRYV